MEKTKAVLFIVAAVALVVGAAVFVSATIEPSELIEEPTQVTACSSGSCGPDSCSGECGGACGVPSCGCGR